MAFKHLIWLICGLLVSFPASGQVTQPTYRYRAFITHIYDADTMRSDIDVGFRMWRGGETLRLYAINTPEIKRSKAKGITSADVEIGYQCRDIMLKALGEDPDIYPHKAVYHEIDPPVEVVIQTVKNQDMGKFGRLLAIVHKDGVNLNEQMIKSGCSEIELYDGKQYPRNTPITPNMGD